MKSFIILISILFSSFLSLHSFAHSCSAFTLQNAVAVGIQFPGKAGTVTIKGGLIKGVK